MSTPGSTPPPSVADQPHPLPLANGHPISGATADAAAQWLTLLMSDEMTDSDYQCWQQWRAAHPDHERAWQHIEAVTARFRELRPAAAYKSLSPLTNPVSAGKPGSPGRRKAMGTLLWLGTAGVGSMLVSRTQTWQQTIADYRTGTGEQRAVYLADGTHIMLNTYSAIDVAFDAQHRTIRLITGDILITTHPVHTPISDPRPFIVETAEGRIRALGTRFTVSQRKGRTHVAVLEHAVEVTLAAAPDRQYILPAGQQLSFTRHTLNNATTLDKQTTGWTQGQIIADNIRLGDFITDLGRYRTGLLRCDPAVAELRLSGVFPLDDTDRILETLPSVLPVRVRLLTRYWVIVEAAS